MGWKEVDKMSLKKEFIHLAVKRAIPMKTLCERFHICRPTGYKWIKRYQQEGEQGLQERSRKPKQCPNETPAKVIDLIVSIRKKHPCWGGRKIQAILKQKGISPVPAPSTISYILKKQGYINQEEKGKKNYIRFEHEHPNSLWQMDFKGHFPFATGRCHPLTIIDDHSRFSPCLKACLDEKANTVKALLIEVFKKHGLPDRINVDNGTPWGSLIYVSRYTTLSVWLIELGIQVSYSRPRHPQTNGKAERFHRTLKAEVLTPHYFHHLKEIQAAFDAWLEIYNYSRPHEALDMDVPGNRYKPSYRSYPSAIEEYDYEKDYLLKRVDVKGRLHFNGKQIYVGAPFRGKVMGVRETLKDGVREIYFRHQMLGKIDLSLVNKGESHNLYVNLD